ncbi:hypothetical protein HMPREF0494_2180, partial [Limosilactobacillus antri DSM 16041]
SVDRLKAIFKHGLATAWAAEGIRLNEVNNDSVALIFNRLRKVFFI